jgi:membrane protein implicated in regulation of membrane protease activity
MLILPISFLVIDSLEKFKKLINSIAFIGILYILNIIISTLFHIKGKSYSGEIFDVGNVFTEGLNSMAYILTAAPLILYLNPKYKRPIAVLSIIIFILVLVQLKRISIIAIFVGFLVNLFFSRNRINIFFGLMLSLLFLFIAYPLFENTLQKQVKARERRLSTQNIEEEGRYQETFVVLDEIVYIGDPALLFFGKEVFNSPGNYANGRFGRRMIHNDYNAILHGSGIIGLFLFVLWPLPLFLFYRKIKLNAKLNFEDKKLFDYMNVTFISFLIMGYILSVSGGVNAILFNSIRMAVLGAVLRIFFENFKTHLKTIILKHFMVKMNIM